MVQTNHKKLKGHPLSSDYVKMDTLPYTPQSMLQKIRITKKKPPPPKNKTKKPQKISSRKPKRKPNQNKTTTNTKHQNKEK